MTKKDLLPLAKTYFDSSPGLREIFGTEDEHFFYRESQAIKHCGVDILHFHFTAEDFEVKEVIEVKEVKEVKLTAKQLLQKEAKELAVEFDETTTSADLKVLIELKKEEG